MLGNTGIKSPKTKTEVKKFGELESVDGKSISLDKKAIDRISSAKPENQLRTTRKEIISAHKAKYQNDGLRDDQILALYNIPTTTTSTK
jgi:hypothetical protein